MILINRIVIDKLRKKETCPLECPVDDNVVAHVTLKPAENGVVHISAHLLSQNPRQRIREIPAVSRTCSNISVLEYDVRDVCTTLGARLRASKTGAKRRALPKAKGFAERVLSIPGIMNPENFIGFAPKGWGKESVKNHVSYYANTIGEFYDQYGEDASYEEFMQFKEELVKEIYDKKYQRPCKDGRVIARRREQIFNGVNERFSYAAIVQSYLLATYPDMDWPNVPIPVSPRCKRVKTENIKAIMYSQYIKVLTLLCRLCEAEVPYAYALLLEAVCGARIGESCAPLIGEFELKEEYGRYYIDYQVDKKGNRTRVLKNEQSHRYAFFGAFLVSLIEMRIQQLKERGYADDAIPSTPFASTYSNPDKFLNKDKVSAFARKLLTLVGCDEAWLEEEAEKMFIAAAAAGTREDVDISAHELRSTLATFWANGGMSINTVDALLGHENERNKTKDFASWTIAEQIVLQMERAIFLGSLCTSHNPAYIPVDVCEDANFSLQGNVGYHFVCQEGMYLEFDLTTLEGNDEIALFLPEEVTTELVILRDIPDTKESKMARPILPELPPLEEIEGWIKEAYEIDLTEIINKYGG